MSTANLYLHKFFPWVLYTIKLYVENIITEPVLRYYYYLFNYPEQEMGSRVFDFSLDKSTHYTRTRDQKRNLWFFNVCDRPFHYNNFKIR